MLRNLGKIKLMLNNIQILIRFIQYNHYIC